MIRNRVFEVAMVMSLDGGCSCLLLARMDADRTPFQVMRALEPDTREPKLRSHLGRFGFAQDQANVRIADLSGGEKARLLFAITSRAAPHILVLDEPTNHLDIEARESLVQALNAYSGAVILITHDPHLIGLVADRLWLVEEGTCRPFEGDIEDYRRRVLQQRRETRRADRPAEKNGDGKRERRREAAREREATAALRKTARKAEARLEEIAAELKAIETQLADPKSYEGSGDKLSDLIHRQGDLKKNLIVAEERWLAAQEAIE
jgi:ATP-binding cassette subfamily F protein 3